MSTTPENWLCTAGPGGPTPQSELLASAPLPALEHTHLSVLEGSKKSNRAKYRTLNTGARRK